MIRSLRLLLPVVFLLLSMFGPAKAQSSASESLASGTQEGEGAHIQLGTADSTWLYRMWNNIQRPGLLHEMMLDKFDRSNEASIDTTKDSLVFEFGSNGFSRRHHRRHVFLITDLDDARQTPYRESFGIMDFNRVDGYFLGLGSTSMVDLGPHDEIGVNGGVGYGFANKAWQYFVGGEYRIPLGADKDGTRDTVFEHVFAVPPTLAFGVDFHNQTSTDDSWRTERDENAGYAFFAREDFRDYYKLAGYDLFLSFRPSRHREVRVEWRSDNYENRDQTVFYGRWGGNKVLPVNPMVSEGRLNSLVVSFREENAHVRTNRSGNVFGDSVDFQQMKGESSILQLEFGHMPGGDSGFNRYLVDSRNFAPITHFLGFDSRLRFEASTGDQIYQKAEFLGGPSSLPALKNKVLGGNRLLLYNTEIRFNLGELSRILGGDMQVVLLNDFGYVGYTGESSIFKGFEGLKFNTIAYNVGCAIGWTNGIQIGASWRTDIAETARVIFRFQRAF